MRFQDSLKDVKIHLHYFDNKWGKCRLKTMLASTPLHLASPKCDSPVHTSHLCLVPSNPLRKKIQRKHKKENQCNSTT